MDDSKKTIKHSSAGNLISLTIDNYYNIKDLNIDASMIAIDQKELLEELIVSTTNEAIDKMLDANGKEMDKEIKDAKLDMSSLNQENISKMAKDLSQFTSIKYEDGKPVLNVSLDNLTPEILLKMSGLMKNDNDKKD